MQLPAHLPRLDGFRGLALVFVVLFHLVVFREDGTWFSRFHYGWMGVDMFFALSGFLIGRILLEDRGRPGWLRTFFARRVLRIFPAYWLTLVFVFFVVPHLAPPTAAAYPHEEFPIYLAYLHNLVLPHYVEGGARYLAHTWSLAIEEHFYLLLPLCVLVLRRRGLMVGAVLVILASPVLRYAYLIETPRVGLAYLHVYRTTPFHLDGLAAGFLLAVVLHGARTLGARPVNWAQRLALVAVLFLAPSFWVLRFFANSGFDCFMARATDPRVAAPMYAFLGVGFAGVVGLLAVFPGGDGLRGTPGPVRLVGRTLDLLFANRVLIWIGKRSYGLYLYQTVVFELMPEQSELVRVAVTVAAASFSYTHFELPILRWKLRFPRPESARRTWAMQV